jgi:UPF0716 family protein affecting phage T7 exclusion
MKFMQLNLTTLIIRFYLMMAVVIVALFAGIPWLAILSLPIFFSALMGISFQRTTATKQARTAKQRDQQFTTEAQAH